MLSVIYSHIFICMNNNPNQGPFLIKDAVKYIKLITTIYIYIYI